MESAPALIIGFLIVANIGMFTFNWAMVIADRKGLKLMWPWRWRWSWRSGNLGVAMHLNGPNREYLYWTRLWPWRV